MITRAQAAVAVVLVCLTLGVMIGGRAMAATVVLPSPAVDDALSPKSGRSTVVLAGGCFWGVEEVFQHVTGVTDAVSGYAGGSARAANYHMVSTGTSGHAEAVKVTYDPSKVTLGQLLKVFFSVVHDPTQLNRQGADIGPQYRSAVFFASERQQEIVQAYLDQLGTARAFSQRIVTQVVPLTAFYEAEEEHQDFAARNPLHPYIVTVDKPKVNDLRKAFPALYR